MSKRSFMKGQYLLKSASRRRVRAADMKQLAIRRDGKRDMNFIGAFLKPCSLSGQLAALIS